MGKGRIFGSVAAFALVLVAATWNGCGSTNDQGISFRALGFFADGDGDVGDTGRCASLRDDTTIPQPTEEGFQGMFLGIENVLVQGINVNRVDLSYRINGANLTVPNDVYALSTRLGPSSGQEPNPPRVFSQITLVSAPIMQFLNDNSSRLPDLPFTMTAFAEVVGTTDAGDEFRTNRVSYQIEFSAISGGCALPSPTPGESLAGGEEATD